MSGKFVRSSKYRHVFGNQTRKESAYILSLNQKPTYAGDGGNIAASSKFFAFPCAGGGGPVVVAPLDIQGRLPAIPLVNVHTSAVLDLNFSPFNDHLLATGSDDGTVKVTVIPEGGVTQTIDQASASLEGHQKKISLVNWHPTASNILLSTSYDGSVKLWDVEAQACSYTYDLGTVASGVDFNENGSQMVLVGKDKLLKVCDPRKYGAAVTGETFPGPKPTKVQWVTFNGMNFIVTMGFKSATRGYQLFDARNIAQPLVSTDLDNSAGVIIPYMDNDLGILYMAGKGDGNIKYYEIADDEDKVYFLTDFRNNESQKGVCFLPKRSCDASTCEIARCLRGTTDTIYPISFQVPRKSDLFQTDIFPDAISAVPALTAQQWLSGKDGNPNRQSMKPGSNAAPQAAAAQSFQAKKSAGDLEKELAAANKRIAELEAELAKLKK
jgi:hypothetical protein